MIEMQESLHEQASAEGSLTARRRWKKAGEICLDQIAQTRNASMNRLEIETPLSAASRMDSIQEGLSSAEPVPITPKYIRTLDKIQERQKRLARQVSTTVEAMKSIEESVVGRILQHPSTRYTHYDAMKLYNDDLTSSIDAITKHHRPPRRSTVGDISRIRPVPIAKIRAVASLRLQETSNPSAVEQNGMPQIVAETENQNDLPCVVITNENATPITEHTTN